MWPTLCKVYTKEDVYKLFSVSVYVGYGKPKSAGDYLNKFVGKINSLQVPGVNVSKKYFEVKIKFFTCDCPKKKKKKKTDRDFYTFSDADYHTIASILTLIKPKIDMLHQFVLDPMHLSYLGIMQRILEYLLRSSPKHKNRLSATMKEEVQCRSVKKEKNILDEFLRKMRHIKGNKKYKAVEHKFLAQYAAPFLFKKILPKEECEHLLLFVMPCRLLKISEKNPLVHINQVRQYLVKFVNQIFFYISLVFSFSFLNHIKLIHYTVSLDFLFPYLKSFSSCPACNLIFYISRICARTFLPLLYITCIFFPPLSESICNLLLHFPF
ncbi:hypothetical protein TSAR_003321 [Trichomalopsis sarcophagae]|uniref:Uncharacterized protein n=1 Tax=Trichomalopsis sarcophagae TaxID=543379 RepID=A0A232EEP1_9HYME|nr:hypothetical protein TSAR_003321 [Trichomalopsis sarcophagae]